MKNQQSFRHRAVIPKCMAIILLFIVFGCASTEQAYDGPERSDSSIAHVSTTGHSIYILYFEDDFIKQVDGRYLGFFVSTAKVLPGRRSFKVQHGEGGGAFVSVRDGFITFEVAAGHNYLIEMDFSYIWAVDENSGEIVAGVKPP